MQNVYNVNTCILGGGHGGVRIFRVSAQQIVGVVALSGLLGMPTHKIPPEVNSRSAALSATLNVRDTWVPITGTFRDVWEAMPSMNV